MATLATQRIARTGLVPAFAAAAGGGDKFTPGSNTYLHVKNGDAGSINVTIVTQGTDSLGNAIADNVIAVAGTTEKKIGPFPSGRYKAASDGLAVVTYSAVTSVTVGVFSTG